jgi:hypothetical protein
LINNRQGGRRRGRGGQRGPNLGGNRQDNRQRGNAAQLLEKYKNMARDAQLAGDRVQSEYYLQFADHYFRVLGENRARFEEQRRQRGDDSSDEDENEEEMVEAGAEDERGEEEQRRRRGNGRDRDRFERNGAPREQAEPEVEDERIAVEALPPAIGRESDEGEAVEAKPRRRQRRPRPEEGEEEIAPAA